MHESIDLLSVIYACPIIVCLAACYNADQSYVLTTIKAGPAGKANKRLTGTKVDSSQSRVNMFIKLIWP